MTGQVLHLMDVEEFLKSAPPEIKGWDEWVPPHLRYRPEDKERFWLIPYLETPDPILPFDILIIEEIQWTYSLAQSRNAVLPASVGFDMRVFNGYCYVSPRPVLDPKEIEERAKIFKERFDYYLKHYDELYEKWVKRVEECIRNIENIKFDVELPKYSPLEEGGVKLPTPVWELYVNFERLIQEFLKVWELHFDVFFPIGYATYLTFRDLCQKLFPGIKDDTLVKMIRGYESPLWRVDKELARLAKMAVELRVAEQLKAATSFDDLSRRLSDSEEGRKWLKEFDEVLRNWCNRKVNGLQMGKGTWREHPEIPISIIRGFVEKLERGERIEIPYEEVVKDRDRITQEYLALIKTEEDRKTFLQLLEVTRKTYPYVENHNFYIDQWFDSIFRMKVAELGRLLTKLGYLENPEDIFLLTDLEIRQVLRDVAFSWTCDRKPITAEHWKEVVKRRARVVEALSKYKPPMAIGVADVEKITKEPMFQVLWGATAESIRAWGGMVAIKPEEIRVLEGIPGSPGVAEGIARVITTPDKIGEVQTGEILVCPCTTPPWTPVFAKVKAVVTDVGGVMSHAAIIGREYGIPVVVGTLYATTVIKTGQRIRVDGDAGRVQIIEP